MVQSVPDVASKFLRRIICVKNTAQSVPGFASHHLCENPNSWRHVKMLTPRHLCENSSRTDIALQKMLGEEGGPLQNFCEHRPGDGVFVQRAACIAHRVLTHAGTRGSHDIQTTADVSV